MTQLSEDQTQLMQKIQYPKGWFSEPVDLQPKPFPYYNAYVNPAFHAQKGGCHCQKGGCSCQRGGDLGVEHGPSPTNQFTSALTQPLNPYTRGDQANPRFYNKGQYQGNGAGVKDVLKRVHKFVKDRKLISRGLRVAATFKPELQNWAEAADKVGYGNKQRGGIIAGDRPWEKRKAKIMPYTIAK